jgi:outer membrane protein TolC
MAQAAHLSDSARLAIATVAWDVRVRLRKALLEFWAARETERLLQESLTARETMVTLLEKEQATGAVSPLEVTRERVSLSQAQLAVLDAESRSASARSQLAMVVGVPESAFDSAGFSFHLFTQRLPDLPETAARRRALLNREDVLGALAEYAAAESALQLEVAKQYPDIHLSPGYEFDQGDNKWGLGLGVQVPILNRNRGRIAEAQAQRGEAAAKFNALQARVLGEIETALAACNNARHKVAVADALLLNSQMQQQLAEKSYAAGEVGRQAVAAARLEAASAALAQFDTRWKAQVAIATLEGALHTPLELPASLFTPVEPPNP